MLRPQGSTALTHDGSSSGHERGGPTGDEGPWEKITGRVAHPARRGPATTWGRQAEDSVTTTDTGIETTASAGSPAGASGDGPDLGLIHDVADRLIGAMTSVIEGKADVVRTTVTVLFAGGHLLIEDVPGVGKTMLAKTLARSIDATVRRIQFTPDLLPSDVTGVSIFNQDARRFEFRPGAIFANVVVGDEIKPRVAQDAVGTARVHGGTAGHRRRDDLHAPGPLHRHGHPEPHRDGGHLPSARGPARPLHGPHLDGLPRAPCRARPAREPWLELAARRPDPVTDAETINRVVHSVSRVHASPAVRQYIVDLVTRSRATRALRLGASPRAALHLLRASRAYAALEGRDHVIPDDVQMLAGPVLAHRLMPSSETQLARRTTAEVVTDLLHQVAGAARSPLSGGASMRSLRSVLTTRGRAFIGSGTVLVLAGVIFGFRDLTRFGVLLVALPLISAVLVRTRKTRMRIERHTHPERISVGQDAHVTLSFENVSTTTTPIFLAEERLAYVLGDRPRFVVGRIPSGRVRSIDYAVRSHLRGRHHLGPLGVQVQDPFGLANRNAVLEGTADLVVLPQVHPLSSNRSPSAGVGSEGEQAQLIALHGEDDVTIREYATATTCAGSTGRQLPHRSPHGAPGGPPRPAARGRAHRPPAVGARRLGREQLVRVGGDRCRVGGGPPVRLGVCRPPRLRRDGRDHPRGRDHDT